VQLAAQQRMQCVYRDILCRNPIDCYDAVPRMNFGVCVAGLALFRV
jgi:hypothetical protein